MAWVLQDASAEEVRQRKESRELLEALRKHGPMWPRDLASLLGLRQDAVRQRLHRLAERGLVRQLDNGKYVVAGPDPDGSDTGRGPHGDLKKCHACHGVTSVTMVMFVTEVTPHRSWALRSPAQHRHRPRRMGFPGVTA
ncbi:MAG: MarR family transcriptional regulator [Anaerolineae bacterium]|nr:MarR family transcriptional regulator [Anaerolineae bacterium]